MAYKKNQRELRFYKLHAEILFLRDDYIEVSGFHLKGSGVFLAYLDVFAKVEVFRLDDNRHDRKVVHDDPVAAWSFTGDLGFGGDNLRRLVSGRFDFRLYLSQVAVIKREHGVPVVYRRLKALSAKVEQEGIVLDENQVAALEKAKEEKQAHGEIETYYPGFLVAQDTYYVGYIKGVGHIYQQTVIDTYSKIGFAKLYDRKNALVAADMLNDRVIPFFEQHDLKLMRMLTDRGTEYCGNRENHEYELYLAVEDIDHSKIKAKSPLTNGICERFNRTVQDEFYAIAFKI